MLDIVQNMYANKIRMLKLSILRLFMKLIHFGDTECTPVTKHTVTDEINLSEHLNYSHLNVSQILTSNDNHYYLNPLKSQKLVNIQLN